MTFSEKLNFSGKELIDISGKCYRLRRDVDSKGRPASIKVYGGEISGPVMLFLAHVVKSDTLRTKQTCRFRNEKIMDNTIMT